MAKVEWTKRASSQLVRIDARYRKTIKDKVEMLTAFPAVNLDITKLTDQGQRYRLRVGDYRVIFEFDKEPKVIEIQEIARRTTRTY